MQIQFQPLPLCLSLSANQEQSFLQLSPTSSPSPAQATLWEHALGLLSFLIHHLIPTHLWDIQGPRSDVTNSSSHQHRRKASGTH